MRNMKIEMSFARTKNKKINSFTYHKTDLIIIYCTKYQYLFKVNQD